MAFRLSLLGRHRPGPTTRDGETTENYAHSDRDSVYVQLPTTKFASLSLKVDVFDDLFVLLTPTQDLSGLIREMACYVPRRLFSLASGKAIQWHDSTGCCTCDGFVRNGFDVNAVATMLETLPFPERTALIAQLPRILSGPHVRPADPASPERLIRGDVPVS